MATITLRSHSIDLQNCLESLAEDIGFEKRDSDIITLISKIIDHSLENPSLFTSKEKFLINGKALDSTESPKVYSCYIDGTTKSKIVEMGKERIMAISFNQNKAGKQAKISDNHHPNSVNFKVKELLEKQLRYILVVFFAKGMKI